MQKIDLTGERFGRLTVIEEAPKDVYDKGTRIKWYCSCDCGGKTIATTSDLKRGHTTSCGCYQKERTGETSRTHGMRHAKVYHVWLDLKNRCDNPNNKRYVNYNGRGIKVCDEWKDNFEAFYEYVSQLPNFGKPGYSIDRIDNNAGYKPGNVRWATSYEQVMNRSNTIRINYHGKETTLPELVKSSGIKYPTLLFHYKKQDLEEYLERRKVNGVSF
ncbi:MAG: hypothetical protein IKS98_01030 [Lachnospiraceae bacterium]|nr:hypothetical protein [Lachnospiraceae bacterium]